MKRLTILLGILPIFVCAALANTTVDLSIHPWEIIQEQNINGVSTTLKIRENPSLITKDWISLEFKNTTKQALLIENASYTIDCMVYTKKGGKLIKKGKITSLTSSELLDNSLDSPFPSSDLMPGTSISSKYPSIIGSVLLSAPQQEKIYVEATLKLNLKLSGAKTFVFNWEEIHFAFEWFRPEPLEFSTLYEGLNHLLENPVYSTLHHYELLAMLSVPEISKGINTPTLLNALKKRNGKEDGRLAILYYLNDHLNDDKAILDYYFELLKKSDPNAINELTRAQDIWDDSFLEPILNQYQNSNLRQMHQLMELLYMHQKSWIKKDGIPAILSDLLLYKHEDIIYKEPSELTKRELYTASLLLDMLGKTGNKEVIPIICPFTYETERILDSGLVLDPNSFELPRPMRVCDNALEALLRLYEKDIIKVYQKEKYRPPYKNGEAEIIITRIRDNLIKDFHKKGKNCK